MTDFLDLTLNALPADCAPLAVLPFGSDLYGTKREFHDIDTAVIIESGRARQLMDGDLDIRISPLDHLLSHASRGALADCEILFALAAGHGRILDERWAPMLRNSRAPFSTYAAMTERHRLKPAFRPKDGIRWDLFLERAWRTGDTDPRLSPTERELYFERLDNFISGRGGV